MNENENNTGRIGPPWEPWKPRERAFPRDRTGVYRPETVTEAQIDDRFLSPN